MTLLETWRAMESLVDSGTCRAIGLSDITLDGLLPIYESARIKPAVVQIEAHPYLPETEHYGNRRTSWKDGGTGAAGLGGAAWHVLAYHA